MNQLLIALLISTSLAGVIQSGFVSSSVNDKNLAINHQASTEVSKAMKDDLSDFTYINIPARETSSTIVENNSAKESESSLAVEPNLKNTRMIQQSSASINKQAANPVNADQAEENNVKKKSKTNVAKAAIRNTKNAENTKETVVAADKEEATTVKSVEKEEGTTGEKAVNTGREQEYKNETKAVNTEIEQDKNVAEGEMNTATDNPEQEEETITVTATAYTANCEGGTGVTYTGIDLKANPDSKVIAVDPSVIPLGTEVYVEGYGNAIAADIGGAIKGNKIDVFIPSESEAEDWGIKTVEVKILDEQ